MIVSVDSSQRDPIDRLAEEFVERFRRGERPSASEYAARYPELAGQVQELLGALVLMEQAGQPAPGGLAGTLGEYQLGREIGRGGMGIVYEAVQESLGRRVALKVLPSGPALTSAQLERFRREAKAAARLHHSNIVPVFGVGEQDGVHYFAMQFIDGAGLDAVLRDVKHLRVGTAETADAGPTALSQSVANSINTPDYFRNIARIVLQTAEALAHAHSHGILHRDVKPANILLDTSGTAWLGDFGLAQLDSDDGLTKTGDLVGTLRYVAPERFAGSGDARSDVYSLGLTLYELLTLRAAFDEADRVSLTRAIADRDPVAPRRIDPRVPRDLETIVLKAIAKQPRHRYRSAEALADDLRRFLADRPIAARRIRPWERAGRWTRRNPALATAVSATATALLVGFVVSVCQWRRADAERIVQKAEREKAERRLRSLRELLARVGEETADWPGNERLRLHLLQQALTGISELANEAQSDPEIYLEWVRLHLRLANLYANMNMPASATEHANAAVDLLNADTSPLSGVNRLRELVQAFEGLVTSHEGQAELQGKYLRQANAAQDELRRISPNDSYLLQFVAKSRLDEGIRAAERADYNSAERALRESIDAARKWREVGPNAARAEAMLAAAFDELAMSLKNQRRLTQVVEAFESALQHAELVPPSRRRADLESLILHNLANLGPATLGQQRYASAWARCFRICERLRQDFPDVPLYADRFASAALGHGVALKVDKRLEDAADAYTRGIRCADDAEARFGPTPSRVHTRNALRSNLGNLLIAQQRYGEATEILRDVLARREAAAKANPRDTLAHASLATTARTLAGCHPPGKPTPESLSLMTKAVEYMRSASSLMPSNSQYRTTLVENLKMLIDYADAAGNKPAEAKAREELARLRSQK